MSLLIWREIIFGSLAVYLCNCQLKIWQCFLPPNLIHYFLVIWAQLTKLISANISGYAVYTCKLHKSGPSY